jgi:hypothetical protein
MADVVVYGLIVCAIAVGATAGWLRYSQKRELEPSKVAHEALGDLWPPDMSLVANWQPTKSTAPNAVAAPGRRLVCPQCQSFCRARGRNGSLRCPFCGQGMVEQVPRIQEVAAKVTVDTAWPIPIQTGVKSAHGKRGACTNCHTVVGSAAASLAPMIQAGIKSPHRNRGACAACHPVVRANGLGPVPTIQADAVAPHPERGTCANCHIVAKLSAAAATLAAAPPIAADAVKPVLIKQFGIEVCPTPGGGAKVSGVMGNSFASKAGLVAGDIVIECNGKKVPDAEGLAQLILNAPAEAEAQLKIMRNDRMKKVAVMVGEGEMEGFTPIQKP